jgi:hypothetical protein
MAKIIKITEDMYRQLTEDSDYYVIGYHGSNKEFDHFSYDSLGYGNDEDGAGFYFFADFENAMDFGKYVYECRLNLARELSLEDGSQANPEHLQIVLRNMGSEDLETYVSNYGYVTEEGEEVPDSILESVAGTIIDYASNEQDAFWEVQAMGYRRDKEMEKTEADFCKVMAKLGYGGYRKVKHTKTRYIMMDANKIQIKQIHRVKEKE